MREVNATELRQNLTYFCNEMIKNQSEFVITRYGEKLALLVPYERKKDLMEVRKK